MLMVRFKQTELRFGKEKKIILLTGSVATVQLENVSMSPGKKIQLNPMFQC